MFASKVVLKISVAEAARSGLSGSVHKTFIFTVRQLCPRERGVEVACVVVVQHAFRNDYNSPGFQRERAEARERGGAFPLRHENPWEVCGLGDTQLGVLSRSRFQCGGGRGHCHAGRVLLWSWRSDKPGRCGKRSSSIISGQRTVLLRLDLRTLAHKSAEGPLDIGKKFSNRGLVLVKWGTTSLFPPWWTPTPWWTRTQLLPAADAAQTGRRGTVWATSDEGRG